MARTNYSFAKRQREIAKKQKKEEKQREKSQRNANAGGARDDTTADLSSAATDTSVADAGADAGQT